jgi:hypothetical protein
MDGKTICKAAGQSTEEMKISGCGLILQENIKV